jgi:hypothetical protein
MSSGGRSHPTQTATVTRKKVAEIKVASGLGLSFWLLKRALLPERLVCIHGGSILSARSHVAKPSKTRRPSLA